MGLTRDGRRGLDLRWWARNVAQFLGQVVVLSFFPAPPMPPPPRPPSVPPTRSIALLGSPLAGRKVRVTTAPPLVVVRKNGAVVGSSTSPRNLVPVSALDEPGVKQQKQSFKVGVAIQARVKLDENGAPISVVATPRLTTTPVPPQPGSKPPLPPPPSAPPALPPLKDKVSIKAAGGLVKKKKKPPLPVVPKEAEVEQEEQQRQDTFPVTVNKIRVPSRDLWDSCALQAEPVKLVAADTAKYFALRNLSTPPRELAASNLIPAQIIPDRLKSLIQGMETESRKQRSSFRNVDDSEDGISWIREQHSQQQQRRRSPRVVLEDEYFCQPTKTPPDDDFRLFQRQQPLPPQQHQQQQTRRAKTSASFHELYQDLRKPRRSSQHQEPEELARNRVDEFPEQQLPRPSRETREPRRRRQVMPEEEPVVSRSTRMPPVEQEMTGKMMKRMSKHATDEYRKMAPPPPPPDEYTQLKMVPRIAPAAERYTLRKADEYTRRKLAPSDEYTPRKMEYTTRRKADDYTMLRKMSPPDEYTRRKVVCPDHYRKQLAPIEDHTQRRDNYSQQKAGRTSYCFGHEDDKMGPRCRLPLASPDSSSSSSGNPLFTPRQRRVAAGSSESESESEWEDAVTGRNSVAAASRRRTSAATPLDTARRRASCLASPLPSQVQEVMHKLYGPQQQPDRRRRRRSSQPLDSKAMPMLY